MYLIFIDDSKQSGRRSDLGKVISLGGIAFPEEQVKPFADEFWRVYDEHGVPHDTELKWSPDSKTSWWSQEGNKEQLTPVREEIATAACALGGKAFVVAWDTETQGFQGETPERLVLRFLFERVEMMLQNLPALGAFIFDRPGGGVKEQDAWVDDALILTDAGTEYVKPNGIILPVLTASSHHHPHLQLADLIVGSTTAALVGNRYGQDLIPLTKPLFHTNWRGNIGGAGVKLYPDALNNLMHWVFGETEFSRGNGGLALPYSRWRWPTDNGLP
ncbi:DUF3800 domain-containing protein [Microbacterium sp.]|uniref:DUF3800 domain-containing protein n=1 Tax=Microbacterium sp. TaxID=51671 RepID=UPI0039E64CE3